MKIFLTGATGYLGRFVLEKLVEKGYHIKCLVRNPDNIPKSISGYVEWIIGDTTDPTSLENQLADFDAVVNLVAIIDENKRKNITFEKLNFEATKNLVDAAKDQGVKRFIHMSALGADVNGTTGYFRTKGKAEQAVILSGLNYTIFRPSFIFGYNHPVFSMLTKVIKTSPLGIVPVFGDGRYKHQPVFVENVAELVAVALSNPRAVNKSYDVGGPEQLTYLQQLEIIAKSNGKKAWPIPVPLGLSKMLVNLIGAFPFAPINSDKLTMLIHDNICDISAIQSDFEINLVSFKDGLNTMK